MVSEANLAPPQNEELEKSILGILLNYPDAISRIVTWFKADYFFYEAHRCVYSVLCDITSRSLSPDTILVTHELARIKKLDDVGGPYFVTSLTDYGIKEVNLEKYCYIVMELWLRREIIHLCMQTEEYCVNQDFDIFDTLDILQMRTDTLDMRLALKETNRDAVQHVRERIHNVQVGDEEAYMMFSQEQLAKALKITKRRIFLIAASKKIGKTKFVVWLIRQLISRYPIALSWHTYEMDKPEIIMELTAEMTKIPVERLLNEKKGLLKLTPEETSVVNKTLDTIASWHIDWNTAKENIETIKNSFRIFAKQNPDKIPVLLIDNFGGIRKSFDKKSQTENEDHIADVLMDIRDQTKGIILVIHHLKKEVMEKDNHESGYMPTTEHIRGTGRLSDYANSVILLHRPGHYPDIVAEEHVRKDDLFENRNGAKWHPVDDMFLVILQESRHGKEEMITCMCDLSINQFEEW